MERAQERSAGQREQRPAGPYADLSGESPETELELLVHGVGGTTPEKMLGDPRTVRVTGDDTAAVFRRAEDAEGAPDGSGTGGEAGAERGRERRSGPVREAYVWCNLTSGDGSRALWLLLLPFMVVNLAHWMRPAAPGRPRVVRLYGLLVRLSALTLTVLLVAAACEVALDLVAWQCAGVQACVRRHSWLDFLSPAAGGWWSAPGRRLALAATLPVTLTGLLWYLSHRTWRAYESHRPLSSTPAATDDEQGPVSGGPAPASGGPGPGGGGAGPTGGRPNSTRRGPESAGGETAPARRGPAPGSGGLESAGGGPEPGAGGAESADGGPVPAKGGPAPGSGEAESGSDGPALVRCGGSEPDRGGREPAGGGPEPGGDNAGPVGHGSALARPGFWYGRRLVARLRAAHTAAGLLTVAAAVTTPAARFDHRPGGPAVLEVLGLGLAAALLLCGAAVVVVVCRRGRSEWRLDQRLDRHLVRRLPLAALALLLLGLVYAGWSRPGWQSTGRLPGDPSFGALMLAQGLLVVALATVAGYLHRRRPDPRAGMRGLGGPAVALLACALGGVISGGVAQRVADWLDGTRALLTGPPVLLTWQASVIPPLLAVLLLLVAGLALHTARLARTERDRVRHEHPGEPEDPARTRAIAHARAMATLTDRAPLVVAVLTATTLVLGSVALAGALATRKTPDGAAHRTHHLVQAVAETSQALGSWLVGLGFLLFVTWGRRAYKDASARRTIGILWDVGTFWPRAAHPFAPPCYAERAVPDLTWRMATWTRRTGGRLVLSGHSQGSVLAAAAAWQLPPSVRGRVALLTYGSPLERLYGRWFPAHFGPPALAALHHDIDCWRNLYRRTDPIGGPVRVPDDTSPDVDHEPLRDPLAYGRTPDHPLPAPILGHSDYQTDPAFTRERARLLTRLHPELPGQRPELPE
ncbi:Integral membrane protein [Streptomyces hygroscopicus subsp. limoneus]|nr:Integral membrane protein [Streptomyces hygroscopicus subsp. limoneus]